MTATVEEIGRLRRMVSEPGADTYSDSELQGYIQRYPVVDGRGESPWVESTTTPGTLALNDDWTATYDLNAAAADVWSEKAGLAAANYDFETQGQGFSRSQAYEQAIGQARYYRSRRNAQTRRMRPEPRDTEMSEDLSN